MENIGEHDDGLEQLLEAADEAENHNKLKALAEIGVSEVWSIHSDRSSSRCVRSSVGNDLQVAIKQECIDHDWNSQECSEEVEVTNFPLTDIKCEPESTECESVSAGIVHVNGVGSSESSIIQSSATLHCTTTVPLLSPAPMPRSCILGSALNFIPAVFDSSLVTVDISDPSILMSAALSSGIFPITEEKADNMQPEPSLLTVSETISREKVSLEQKRIADDELWVVNKPSDTTDPPDTTDTSYTTDPPGTADPRYNSDSSYTTDLPYYPHTPNTTDPPDTTDQPDTTHSPDVWPIKVERLDCEIINPQMSSSIQPDKPNDELCVVNEPSDGTGVPHTTDTPDTTDVQYTTDSPDTTHSPHDRPIEVLTAEVVPYDCEIIHSQISSSIQPDRSDTPSSIQPDTTSINHPDPQSSIQPDTSSISQPDSPSSIQPDTSGIDQPNKPSSILPDTSSINQPDKPSSIQPDTSSIDHPDSPSSIQPNTSSINQPDSPSSIQPNTSSINQPDSPSSDRLVIDMSDSSDVEVLSSPDVSSLEAAGTRVTTRRKKADKAPVVIEISDDSDDSDSDPADSKPLESGTAQKISLEDVMRQCELPMSDMSSSDEGGYTHDDLTTKYTQDGLTATGESQSGPSDWTCQESGPSLLTCQESGPSLLTCQESGPSLLTCQESGPSLLTCQESGPSLLTCQESVPSLLTCQESGPSVLTYQELSPSDWTCQESGPSLLTCQESGPSLLTCKESSSSVSTNLESILSTLTYPDMSGSPYMWYNGRLPVVPPKINKWCLVCRKFFDSPADLKAHPCRSRYFYRREKSQKCMICLRVYKNYFDFRLHVCRQKRKINKSIRHQQKKPKIPERYKCTGCTRTFKSQYNVKHHRCKHTKVNRGHVQTPDEQATSSRLTGQESGSSRLTGQESSPSRLTCQESSPSHLTSQESSSPCLTYQEPCVDLHCHETSSSDMTGQVHHLQKPEKVQKEPEKVQRKPTKVQKKPEKVQEKPETVQEKPEKVQEKPETVQEKPETAQEKPEKVHRCVKCSRRFKSPADLKAHKCFPNVHKCWMCRKAFKNYYDFRLHQCRLKTNTEKSAIYKCINCFKGFRSSSDLKLHLCLLGKNRNK